MSETITIRAMERSDLDGVLGLLRAALGEPPGLQRTPQLFAWKHFDNPFGPSIALVATSGDRIVGLRCFMRWQLTTPDGTLLNCVRAVDTATHPEFHRRGIFRRLTEEAVDVAIADDVDLIFNTPNAKSGSGYLSMGWVEVGQVGVLMRPTRHFFRTGDDRFGSRRETSTPTWNTAPLDRGARGLRTPRTREYLNWRFGSHPTARYFTSAVGQAEGILRSSQRRGREELLVSELFGAQSHRVIRKAARATDAAYVATWFSRGSPERAAAVRAGLTPIPRVRALTLVARPLRELDVDVSSMNSWDLSLGDLELL